jgi:hypothetical protein
VSRAQGGRWCCGPEDGMGRRHHGLGEDDSAVGPRMTWVDDIVGLGTVSGAQHLGLSEDDVVAGSGTASWAWVQRLRGRRCHQLGSGRGRWWCIKGLNRGWERWCESSGEDSMMVWRLRGGLDDGAEAPGRT